jgi:uncharacterized protein HemY
MYKFLLFLITLIVLFILSAIPSIQLGKVEISFFNYFLEISVTQLAVLIFFLLLIVNYLISIVKKILFYPANILDFFKRNKKDKFNKKLFDSLFFEVLGDKIEGARISKDIKQTNFDPFQIQSIRRAKLLIDCNLLSEAKHTLNSISISRHKNIKIIVDFLFARIAYEESDFRESEKILNRIALKKFEILKLLFLVKSKLGKFEDLIEMKNILESKSFTIQQTDTLNFYFIDVLSSFIHSQPADTVNDEHFLKKIPNKFLRNEKIKLLIAKKIFETKDKIALRFFIEKCLDEKWSDDLSFFYLKSISDDAKPHLSKIETWIKQKDIQKNKGLVLLSYLSVINDIKGQAKKNLSEVLWEDLDLNFKIISIYCYQLLDKTKESEHYLKKLFEEI